MDKYSEIAMDRLQPHPDQPRKHYPEASLNELAQSLKKDGQIEPLVVREFENYFQIVCGERRYRAAKIAGIKNLDCHIRELTDDQVFDIQLQENLQRESLTPLDECDAFHKLIKIKKFSLDELADRYKKSTDYIFGRLRLIALIDEGRKMLEEEILPVTAAIKIAALTEIQQREAIKRLIVPMIVGDKTESYFTGLRDMKAFFDNSILMPLALADFNPDDEKLLPCGSCKLCPKRTGNSLFGDIATADQCLDNSCYHDKHVRFYQKLQEELSKKMKISVVFAARHYNVEKNYKDLPDVLSMMDWETITDKQSKTERNAKYVIFVGINTTSDEPKIEHGWVKVRQKIVEKQKTKQDKPKKIDPIEAQKEELTMLYLEQNLFKQFESKAVNPGREFDALAFSTAILFEEVGNQIPKEILLHLIKKYRISIDGYSYENGKRKELLLDKDFNPGPNTDYGIMIMQKDSHYESFLKIKGTTLLLEFINDLIFFARDERVKHYKLDEKSAMKEAKAQVEKEIQSQTPAAQPKKAKKKK